MRTLTPFLLLLICTSKGLFQPQSTHPVWSPDGAKIAFINNSEGFAKSNPIDFEIFTINIDGTELEQHTFNDVFEADISWSPDSRQIAYRSYQDGNDEIYVLNLETGTHTNISNHPLRDSSPFWMPNEDELVFNSLRDQEEGEFYSYSFKSNSITRLTFNHYQENGATYSPSRSLIAFVSNLDGDDDIYISNLDGSGFTQLTNGELNDWYPVWSPDGTFILYTYGNWKTDEFELRLINVETKADTKLIEKTDSGNATWSPDGTKIAFGQDSEIFIYDLITEQITQLTHRINNK